VRPISAIMISKPRYITSASRPEAGTTSYVGTAYILPEGDAPLSASSASSTGRFSLAMAALPKASGGLTGDFAECPSPGANIARDNLTPPGGLRRLLNSAGATGLLVLRQGIRPLIEVSPAEIGQRQPDRQPRSAVLGKFQVVLDGLQILGRDQLKILVDEMDDVSSLQRSFEQAVAIRFLFRQREDAVHD